MYSFRASVPAFAFVFLLSASAALAQCPEIISSSLNSPDCVNGSTPCDLCPGDSFTLSVSGDGLPHQGCINWYYGTTPGFNPYNGEGTLIGCAAIDAPPPAPCSTCPEILLIWIDACGPEAPNEFMIVGAGSGFNVNNFGVNFAPQNNNPPPLNDDINTNGGSCNWQTPTPAIMATVENSANCNNVNVVAAGPGTAIPAGAIVIIFTSSAASTDYNFENFCAEGHDIYVMQNACARGIGAFSNNTSNGTRTTSIVLNNCNCSHSLTHDTDDPALIGDGDYAYYNNGAVEYGNSGCANPTPPYVEPPQVVFPPSSVEDVSFTVTTSLCNGGPYYVVGIVEPLGANCNEVFTDEFSFNVLCPEATASVEGTACIGSTVTLQAGGGSTYTWSGPNGFASSEQNPVIGPLNAGSAGTYTVTVTNTAGCEDVAQVTLTLLPEVQVSITPAAPSFCPGQSVIVTASGQGGGGNFQYAWETPGGPASGPSVEISQAGTFTVTLTDANGCTATATGSATLDDGPTVTIFPDPARICQGDSIELTAIVTGGAGGNQYLWTDPLGNVFFESTLWARQGGTFSVQVTDQNGCTGDVSINVDLNALPIVQIAADPPLLCDGGVTTLTATGSGGTGDYSFQWVTPSGNATENPLVVNAPGNYLVTLTDDAGCIGTDTFDLEIAPPLAVTVSPANPSFCAGGSVMITVQVQGHQGNPLSYIWDTPSGPAGGSTLTTNTPGLYSVTVTEDNGCTGTATVEVTETTGLSISILPSELSLCPGGAAWITGQANGGDGNYEYIWLFDGGPVFSDSLLITQPGTYALGAVDGNNCEGLDSIVVLTADPVDITIVSTSDGLCAGTQATLTLDPAPQPGWAFLWTTPSGTSNTYPLVATESGNYQMEVTYGGGCTSIAAFDLAALPTPDIQLLPANPSFCTGGSVLLQVQVNAGGPIAGYAWSTPSGPGNTPTLTATLAGTYAVTVTNQDGCTSAASTAVSIASGLAVSFPNTSITICGGTQAELVPEVQGGAEPYTYAWSGPTGLATGAPLVTGTPGNYQVTVTDINGCNGIAAVQVLLGAALTVEIQPPIPGYCEGTSVELIASAPGGQPPFQYQWSTPLGQWLSATGLATTAGTYSVVVTDASGCSGSSSVFVQEWETPSVQITPLISQLCAGQTIPLSAIGTGGTPPYSFVWSGPAGDRFDAFYPEAGAGDYGLTITDSRGCQSVESFAIEEVDQLSVQIAADGTTICGNASVTVSAVVLFGQEPLTYAWITPSGTSALPNTQVTLPGWVFLEVTDANGCRGVDSLLLNEGQLDVIVQTTPERCPGAADGSLTILDIGQGSLPILVRVNNGITQAVTELPFHIDGLSAGVYTIDLADAGGCEFQSVMQIQVLFIPQILFPQLEITLLQGESVTLSPSYQFDPISYQWSPSNGLSCTTCASPVASPTESTTYTVTATDDVGCEAMASIRINTVGNTRIYIPSAISPNFDGINDVFYIHAADDNVRIAELSVFDRWGNQLYNAVDLPVNDANYGWDGSYRGKRMEPGVYVYTARVVFPDGFSRLYRGELTIVY